MKDKQADEGKKKAVRKTREEELNESVAAFKGHVPPKNFRDLIQKKMLEPSSPPTRKPSPRRSRKKK